MKKLIITVALAMTFNAQADERWGLKGDLLGIIKKV